MVPYGITTSGNALTLKFVTRTDVGSRVYLMADDNNYQMFKLKNQEFTFDLDVSNLPCCLNGALYFSLMDADGSKAKYTNKAGAKYGTGYCDAQCPMIPSSSTARYVSSLFLQYCTLAHTIPPYPHRPICSTRNRPPTTSTPEPADTKLTAMRWTSG